MKVKLSKKALTLVRTHKLSTVRVTATVPGASAATAGSKTYKLKLARTKRKKRH